MGKETVALAGMLTLALALPSFAEGVVTVAAQGNDLTLRGDGNGNNITILPGDVPSQIRIVPSNGTTLNGFELPIDFPTPARTLDIRLDGGDDSIVITGGVDAGDILVVFGTGSNSLTITSSRFDDVAVDGSDGDDDVSVTDSAVEGNLDLDLLGGMDTVTLAGTTAVGGKTTIAFGSGDDTLSIEGTNFGKRVKIDFADGADGLTATGPIFKSAASIKLGAGGSDDVLLDTATFLKKPTIKGSDDPLTLTLQGCDAKKGATIKCGNAADIVTVTGSTAGKPLSLKTRGGNDTIRFTGNQLAKKPKLLGGDDDDVFTVETNTFDKGALIHGGSGTDTQSNDIENTNTLNRGKIKVKSVEESD